jgi:hypothetical protein
MRVSACLFNYLGSWTQVFAESEPCAETTVEREGIIAMTSIPARILADASGTVAAAAIFAIVGICSYVGLRQSRMFGSGPAACLSVCTALLAAISLTNPFPSPPGASATDLPVREACRDLDGLLVPYAALGLTFAIFPLLLFLLFLGRWLRKLRARFRGELKAGTEMPRDHDEVTLLDNSVSDSRPGKPHCSDQLRHGRDS